jgi:hypothetical protein
MMSYIDLNWDFSQFDRDNMNRYMSAAFARFGNQVAADILADPDAGRAADELAAADRLLGASRLAFRHHRYLAAAFTAKAAYDLVRKGPGRPGCRWSAAPRAGRSTSRAASRRRTSWPRAPRTRTPGCTATGCAAEPNGV